MIGRWILWLSILWVAPLICYMMKNEAKFKKNIAVGVTLPYEGRTDQEVTARLARFRREMDLVCAALLALAVPCLFVKDFLLSFTLWCAWVIPCLALPCLPYARCNRDLKRLKRERGWAAAPSERISVDTAAIPAYRWMSPAFFALPLAVSLLPLLWERDFALLYGLDALCVAAFWLGYRALYRRKSERIDDDALLTGVLTRIRHRNWGRVWILSSWGMAAINLAIWLTRERPALMLLAIMAVGAALTAALLRVEMNTRRMQEKLAVQSGRSAYVDEDDQWIWGLLYYNPRDSHTLVNDRVGTNVSLNLARPAGRICMAAVALMVLALPFLGPLISAAADQPPELALTDTELIAGSGRKEYRVALSGLAGAELRETLPENLVRTNGTGLENLLRGQFSARELGRLNVCLDPGVPPFLLLTEENGRRYLVGTRDADRTREIYRALTADKDGL